MFETPRLLSAGRDEPSAPFREPAPAAEIPWRPLGRLLVEKGLLEDEQLERALAEQSRVGARLGEILVELGFITQSRLSLALAEQYGFELVAETGFGTGLRAQLERRPAADEDGGAALADAAVDCIAPAPAPAPPEPAADDRLHLAQLEEQWAKLAAAEDRLLEAEQRLAALQRREERRRAQVVRLVERIRRSRGAEDVRPAPEPAAAHLLFAQAADRYELLERDGAPPRPDSRLRLPELGTGLFVVTKVAASPLPNDPRACAYVQAVPEPPAARSPFAHERVHDLPPHLVSA